MRIPVFARRTNPAIDKPILRKSMAYGESEVAFGNCDWVDPLDHSKGIIARTMLHFGEKALPVETVEVDFAFRNDGELRGVKFVPPKTNLKPSYAAIREGWDWQTEANLMTA